MQSEIRTLFKTLILSIFVTGCGGMNNENEPEREEMAYDYLDLGPQYFALSSAGKPVAGGQIFIGNVNTDPEIPANQKQVQLILQDGSRVDVGQPVRTSAGGIIEYNGSPAIITTDGDYSMKVLSSNGAELYYFAEKKASGIPSANEQETINLIDGTEVNPSLSFINHPQDGLYHNGSNIVFVSSGVPVNVGGPLPKYSGVFAWSTGSPSIGGVGILNELHNITGDGVNLLLQDNGADAAGQTFRIQGLSGVTDNAPNQLTVTTPAGVTLRYRGVNYTTPITVSLNAGEWFEIYRDSEFFFDMRLPSALFNGHNYTPLPSTPYADFNDSNWGDKVTSFYSIDGDTAPWASLPFTPTNTIYWITVELINNADIFVQKILVTSDDETDIEHGSEWTRSGSDFADAISKGWVQVGDIQHNKYTSADLHFVSGSLGGLGPQRQLHSVLADDLVLTLEDNGSDTVGQTFVINALLDSKRLALDIPGGFTIDYLGVAESGGIVLDLLKAGESFEIYRSSANSFRMTTPTNLYRSHNYELLNSFHEDLNDSGWSTLYTRFYKSDNVNTFTNLPFTETVPSSTYTMFYELIDETGVYSQKMTVISAVASFAEHGTVWVRSGISYADAMSKGWRQTGGLAQSDKVNYERAGDYYVYNGSPVQLNFTIANAASVYFLQTGTTGAPGTPLIMPSLDVLGDDIKHIRLLFRMNMENADSSYQSFTAQWGTTNPGNFTDFWSVGGMTDTSLEGDVLFEMDAHLTPYTGGSGFRFTISNVMSGGGIMDFTSSSTVQVVGYYK